MDLPSYIDKDDRSITCIQYAYAESDNVKQKRYKEWTWFIFPYKYFIDTNMVHITPS